MHDQGWKERLAELGPRRCRNGEMRRPWRARNWELRGTGLGVPPAGRRGGSRVDVEVGDERRVVRGGNKEQAATVGPGRQAGSRWSEKDGRW